MAVRVPKNHRVHQVEARLVSELLATMSHGRTFERVIAGVPQR